MVIIDESDFTPEIKNVMKDIFKRFSKNGIRLSVEMIGKDYENITQVVPVSSADRPCMFFLLGDSQGIMQRVRLITIY